MRTSSNLNIWEFTDAFGFHIFVKDWKSQLQEEEQLKALLVGKGVISEFTLKEKTLSTRIPFGPAIADASLTTAVETRYSVAPRSFHDHAFSETNIRMVKN